MWDPSASFRPMDHDSADHPKTPASQKARRGSKPDLPPQDPALLSDDFDPAISATDEDDEARLPETPDEPAEAIGEGPLAGGPAPIENAGRLEPHTTSAYPPLH